MSLCAQCARVQRTCCQYTDVLVTDGDILRIREYTDQPDFYENRIPVDPSYLDQNDDPNWNAYTVLPDKSRRVLKQQENRDCIFLTEQGCVLPLEARPLVCRLYPIYFTESGLDGLAEGCPPQLQTPGKPLLDAVGVDIVSAERWRHLLYHELRTGSVLYENRHYLRPAG
ncbi:MAG: hypothetical protein AB1656_24385 [Candidatus Omnitrophota bacterium]